MGRIYPMSSPGRPGDRCVMSRRRKDGPSDDPTSLKTMRGAVLQCLMCCESLITLGSLGIDIWHKACREGDVQSLIDGLNAAIKNGKGIEGEQRLTFGPERTFGDVTGRNAHMAALLLAVNVKGMIDVSVYATGSPATEDLRGKLWQLSRGNLQADQSASIGFSYAPRYDFTAWREAIHSESDRAARIALPPPQKPEREPAKLDKLTEARDKWVYNECCKGTAYDLIARNLPNKNHKWARIDTKQGILACAKRYAKRHRKPEPPPRQGL